MLINEVQSIVGLSRKSIRFYESVGLLNPKRNESDYRIYSENDIKILKVIKFLRDLGVPIFEIQKLQKGTLKLSDCLKDRIEKIENEEQNYQKVKNMCLEIINHNCEYHDFDISKYSIEVNILRKKGFSLMDIKKNNTKKIIGALISSLVFASFFLFILGILTYFQFTENDPMPMILYSFFVFVLGIPIVGAIYNLIIRIKEIKGGEEDEASKY